MTIFDSSASILFRCEILSQSSSPIFRWKMPITKIKNFFSVSCFWSRLSCSVTPNAKLMHNEFKIATRKSELAKGQNSNQVRDLDLLDYNSNAFVWEEYEVKFLSAQSFCFFNKWNLKKSKFLFFNFINKIEIFLQSQNQLIQFTESRLLFLVAFAAVGLRISNLLLKFFKKSIADLLLDFFFSWSDDWSRGRSLNPPRWLIARGLMQCCEVFLIDELRVEQFAG